MKMFHAAAFQPKTETADGFVGHFGAKTLIGALDEATRRWGPPVTESRDAVGRAIDQGLPPGGMIYRTAWQEVELTEFEVVGG